MNKLIVAITTIGLVLAAPLQADNISEIDLHQENWLECKTKDNAVIQIGSSADKYSALLIYPKSSIEPIVKAYATYYPDRIVVHYRDTAGAPLRIKSRVSRKDLSVSVESKLEKTGRIIYEQSGIYRVIANPFRGNKF